MGEIRKGLLEGTLIEIGFQDKMWVGQKNKLTKRWARGLIKGIEGS